MTEMGVSICPILRLAADVSKSCHAQTLANTPKPLTAYTANAFPATVQLVLNTENDNQQASKFSNETTMNATVKSVLPMLTSASKTILKWQRFTTQGQKRKIT
jgi:hypothetical protein